jgi:dTDP-4-amino-4,6-dideoxygalactose transaminase
MTSSATERPIPLLDLAALHRPLAADLRDAFERVLQSGQFILGAEHDAFERELAAACGVKHAVGLASGTAAISVGLLAAGVKPGDDVLVPAFTYFATASAVVHAGARPVFADVEPVRFGFDPAGLEAALTPKTTAIVPVHLYGLACDLEPVRAFAERRGLVVLEDAAQAIGGTDRGRPVGTTTAGATLSFFPTKNLGALGDAGALLTDRDDVAERTRLLRVHGDAGNYRHTALGTNARLDGLQAALLRVKLRHLGAWTEGRRRNAATYREALAGSPVTLPAEPEGALHTYHQFTIRAPRRDALQAHLRDRGIASRIYYPIPVPAQPCFDPNGECGGRYPTSEALAADVLSLPVGPELETVDVRRVAAAVHAFYGTGSASR